MKPRKIIISFMALILCFSIIAAKPINALSENINIIYENKYISKYTLNENNKMYTIINDRINDLLIVNNLVYDIESLSASYNQFQDHCYENLLTRKPIKENIINYEDLYNETQQYESQIHLCNFQSDYSTFSNISPLCTTCPLKTTAVPKSGYNTKGYVISIKEIDVLESFALGSSATTVSYVTTLLKITTTVASQFISFLLASGFIAGMIVCAGKTVTQYTHKTCYKAIKEVDKLQAKEKKGNKKASKDYSRYYYNARP